MNSLYFKNGNRILPYEIAIRAKYSIADIMWILQLSKEEVIEQVVKIQNLRILQTTNHQ